MKTYEKNISRVNKFVLKARPKEEMVKKIDRKENKTNCL